MELFQKFGIDWRLLVMQIINFAILLFILKRYLYKPVMDMLERRREQVKKNFETTEQIQLEFEAFKSQKEEEFSKARLEARGIVDTALERASQIEAKAGEDAKVKSAEILARAKKVIHEEKEKIVDEAKREVAGIVIAATEKVLGKKFEGKEAEELVRQGLHS
ncbi:F0F1 ATP synthase subunit B [Candidatus Azambacteria bacterium]|nr:F0F1 ATP synthase subunit B [Candidatus Azambacteria bacterium]